MADDPASWGAQPAASPQEGPEAWGAQPAGLDRSQTFASSEFAKQYAAEQFKKGNYLRFIAGGLGAIAAGGPELMMSLFGTSREAYQKGLTPDKETELGVNASLLELGGGKTFMMPKGTAAAFNNFHEQVTVPVADKLASYPGQVGPVEGSDIPREVPRSNLALTGEPHVDAILNSPTTKGVIDNPTVDRSHDVPYTAGGSVPLQDPTMFIDKHFPHAFNIDGVVFDPADPFAIHENIEQHTMDILTKGGMDEGAAYKVAHFEFAEKAEGAWYKAHGIDQEKAEAAYAPYMAAIQHDQGADFPPNLYERPYPHDTPSAAKSEAIAEPRPSPEEIDHAKQIIADWQAKGAPTPEPEAPKPAVNPLVEAHELGVIGPDKSNPPEESPAKAAQRAIPAARTGDDKITMTPAGEPIDAWEERFKDWVRRVKEPDDVKPFIEQAAASNNNFPDARAGQINPAHAEIVAEAAGIDPTKMKLSVDLNNPDRIRMVKQALDVTLQDFKEAAAKVETDPSEGNIAKMLEAEIRRDYVVEYVAGLRAEWGKSGHALRDLLEPEQKAVSGLTKGETKAPLPQPPKEIKDIGDAAKRVANNLEAGKEDELGLDKLIKSAMDLVDGQKDIEAKAKAEGTRLSPEWNELVKTANAVVNLMDIERRTGPGVPTVRPLRQLITEGGSGPQSPLAKFNKLVSDSERLASGMGKQPGVSRVDALPDPLRDLVNRAKNVSEFFGGSGLERKVQELLAQKGRTVEDMQNIARGMRNLSNAQAARVLTDMRGNSPHWFYWMWVQGLISGPFTHAKYIAANALYAATERGLVTPLASVLGRFRTGPDKVFPGEAWRSGMGTVSAIPDAVKSAYETVKSGMRVPLESEKQLFEMATAKGEGIPKEYLRAVNPVTQMQGRPIPGVWGRVIGAPGDMASAIHTTFKVLGERANLEAWAYHETKAEGLSTGDPTFWDRYDFHKANPTEQVLKDSVYQAYKDTFMQPLPEGIARRAAALKEGKVTGWIFPFTHIPINLLRATYEYTPFAYLDPEMRAAIKGEKGGRQQDLAISRMVVGSAVMGYLTHKYMLGQATGGYPAEQKERNEWKLTGKIPNAMQLGDQWVSFERFGPAGGLASLGADIGHLVASSDVADPENWTKLTWQAANAAANVMADFPGFQSIQNLMRAKEDPQQGAKWMAWQAGSLLPFSSLVSQTASFADPQMRVARTFLDGLLYRLPGAREVLAPKRDPLYGEPVVNPGFENVIRKAPVDTDPAKEALTKLGYIPTAPSHSIGGVKLTPQQYDKYEATAGPLVKQALGSLVASPQWRVNGPEWQKQVAKEIISAARQKAATAMKLNDPSIVQAGRQRRLQQINGAAAQ